MAYTRTYRTTIPLEADGNADVMRWLTRESFEHKAAGDALRIVDYSEAELSADEIPPKVAKQLPNPISDYRWFTFTATATATVSASA